MDTQADKPKKPSAWKRYREMNCTPPREFACAGCGRTYRLPAGTHINDENRFSWITRLGGRPFCDQCMKARAAHRLAASEEARLARLGDTGRPKRGWTTPLGDGGLP